MRRIRLRILRLRMLLTTDLHRRLITVTIHTMDMVLSKEALTVTTLLMDILRTMDTTTIVLPTTDTRRLTLTRNRRRIPTILMDILLAVGTMIPILLMPATMDADRTTNMTDIITTTTIMTMVSRRMKIRG